MTEDWFELIEALVCPLLTAQLFMLFLGYFAVVKKQISRHYKFYICFLLGLLYYLVLKPVQTYSYSLDHFTRYTRTLVLFTLAAPALAVAACHQCGYNLSRRKTISIFLIGLLFGGAYSVTYDLVERSNGFCAALGIESGSAFTTHFVNPYTTQLVGGIILFLIPSLALVYHELFVKRDNRRPAFLIGTLIFGLAFVVGSWTKEWWIYYVSAFISAAFWGWTIFRDINRMKGKAERLAPLIREELLQNITTYTSENTTLKDLFTQADIKLLPNRFMVIRPVNSDSESHRQVDVLEHLTAVTTEALADLLDEKTYLIMDSGTQHIAVCYHDSDVAEYNTAVELAESIREKVMSLSGINISIGIGAGYGEIQDLRFSYNEASDVSHYLVRSGSDAVMAFSDIRPSMSQGSYPFNQRNAVVEMVKAGSSTLIPKAVSVLCGELMTMCRDDLSMFKQKIGEVIFVLVDTALQSGIQQSQVKRWDHSVNSCVSVNDIAEIMTTKAVEISTLIAEIPETHKTDSMLKAKAFIEEQFLRDISVEEIAEHVGLSRSYFMSTFKKQMGLTVNQYLTKMRMEKAKVMLLTKSVTDTAFAIGYNDSNYFSKVFKKQTGMTPSEFQQSAK